MSSSFQLRVDFSSVTTCFLFEGISVSIHFHTPSSSHPKFSSKGEEEAFL